MLVYPMARTTYMSFWRWPYTDPSRIKFVGLDNYIELFTEDTYFLTSLVFTLRFTAVTILIEFAIGMLSTLALDNVRFLRNAIRSIVFLPYMVAPIAAGLVWRLLWARDFGLVNYLYKMLGGEAVNWLGSADFSFWALVTTEVWRAMPFDILILLAGLSSIPPEILEAAKVDGSNAWQTFRYVIFPLLLPSVTIALVFQTIFKLRVFDLVFTLTGGGPGKATTPLGLLTQRTYFRDFEGGYAGAIAVILLLLGGLVSWLYVKMIYREVEY
jgi:multiple sugar transport system permease protein